MCHSVGIPAVQGREDVKSYLVLARKWRPQVFADLVGQEHVSRTLQNAITSDRVHHAFLFTGARGVGKTSAARIFAKALNCQQGITTTPCGTCASCIDIAGSQGIDVLEIDGASHNGVDDIRELREAVRYLPSQARYKIIIIDEVHMLSKSAFNALLKTLEEPPAHVKFIFATTEPHKIPLTILSRCQRFDFKKILLPALVARLRYIVAEEGVVVSDAGLTAVARQAGGSMRDALSLLDQIIACCGNEVDDEALEQLLGLVGQQLILATLAAMFQRDPASALQLARQVDDLGHCFRQFCRQLIDWLRALVMLKVTDDPAGLVDLSAAELQSLAELGASCPLEEVQRILAALIRAEAELAESSYPRLTLEVTLVRLATLPTGIEVTALIERLGQLEQRLAGHLTAAPAKKRPEPPAAASPEPSAQSPIPPEPVPLPEEEPPAADSEPVPADRHQAAPVAATAECGFSGLVDFVKQRRRPRISALLEQASLLQLELPLLEISLPQKFYGLADSDMLQALQELAGEYFATEVRVRIVKGRNGEPQPPSLHEERTRQESDRQRKLRQNALEHPMIKAALDIFGGDVESVTPTDKGFV